MHISSEFYNLNFSHQKVYAAFRVSITIVIKKEGHKKFLMSEVQIIKFTRNMHLYAINYWNVHLFLKRPKYANICYYNFLSDSAASKITPAFTFSAKYSSCSQNMHYMQFHNSVYNNIILLIYFIYNNFGALI